MRRGTIVQQRRLRDPCESDSQCPAFNRCREGKCETRVASPPRVRAATRNVEAVCSTEHECVIPCQTDLECGSPTSYSFFSCIANQCTYTGCESDKDCDLYLTGRSGEESPTAQGRNTRVVCRERKTQQPGVPSLPPPQVP